MTEEPDFVQDRWVRIMCDYAADGVWDREGRSRNADDLPVSAELIARILRWQDWFETLDPVARDGPIDWAEFSAEGLAIARAVKAELPDWTVIYFDDAKSDSAPRAPRSHYEYEIHLTDMQASR